MATVNNKSILAMMMMLLAACNADVVPGDVEKETGTDGGYGDSGGTDGEPNPDECWAANAPAGAVRWQCEGMADASVSFTLDVEIPDVVQDAELLQQIIDSGHIDFGHSFGTPLAAGPARRRQRRLREHRNRALAGPYQLNRADARSRLQNPAP